MASHQLTIGGEARDSMKGTGMKSCDFLAADKVKSIKPPKGFADDMAVILVDHILQHMGEVRRSKLEKLADVLYGTARYIADSQNTRALYRQSTRTVRVSRQAIGRSRTHVLHSIESLKDAEEALRPVVKELKPGMVNFLDASKSLEGLEKTLSYLETTTAAVIHPGLRTRDEKTLAAKSPHKLHDQALPITEGSAALQYLAVELIDNQLQKFTNDIVSPRQIDLFISKFLKMSLGWQVEESNVKTMRHRIKMKNSQPKNNIASGPVISVR